MGITNMFKITLAAIGLMTLVLGGPGKNVTIPMHYYVYPNVTVTNHYASRTKKRAMELCAEEGCVAFSCLDTGSTNTTCNLTRTLNFTFSLESEVEGAGEV